MVEDMTLEDFLEKFKESFSDYVEHVVLSWYLRNAKMEAFKLETMPGHMMSFVADFAQNIKVIKRSETAEEVLSPPRGCHTWNCFRIQISRWWSAVSDDSYNIQRLQV